MKRLLFLNIFFVLALVSCARAPVRDVGTLETIKPYPVGVPEKIAGAAHGLARGNVVHEVGPGETVWRISKMYDVPIENIVKANHLKDITKLEEGQKLIIRNAAPLRSVIPLYPSAKWHYIIIHHSATDAGNALNFDYAHKKRHWKGLGYQFVIDNGTAGKQDGQIEVSPRWIRQENGAHCKAGGMNYNGIGICLVGNFSVDTVTPKQMESLVYLVNTLKDYYRIPASHILGHGQVKGASTECPGRKFPWKEFRSRLTP